MKKLIVALLLVAFFSTVSTAQSTASFKGPKFGLNKAKGFNKHKSHKKFHKHVKRVIKRNKAVFASYSKSNNRSNY